MGVLDILEGHGAVRDRHRRLITGSRLGLEHVAGGLPVEAPGDVSELRRAGCRGGHGRAAAEAAAPCSAPPGPTATAACLELICHGTRLSRSTISSWEVLLLLATVCSSSEAWYAMMGKK